MIVNRHKEALLSVATVSSHFDIRALRKLHNTVEAHIRGLHALGIPAETYGGLLTSVLTNKLPSEISLIVSLEMTAGNWDLDGVMKILDWEVEARERATNIGGSAPPCKTQTRTPTGATLFTNNSGSGIGGPSCVYCGLSHASTSCTTITDVTARKNILRKAGRCYICLWRNHLSKDCRSGFSCRTCRGRHHVTICSCRSSTQGIHPPAGSQATVEKCTQRTLSYSRWYLYQYYVCWCTDPHLAPDGKDASVQPCICHTVSCGSSCDGEWQPVDICDQTPLGLTHLVYNGDRVSTNQDLWSH